MQILKWGLALALGGFLLFFGFMKFSGGAHIFPYIEYKATGLGLPFGEFIHPLMNWATGGLEIVAGATLILPMTRSLGSKLAVLPFLGAVLFHLSPLLGVETPAGYADPKPVEVLADGGPFAASDFSPEMTSVLFMMALIGLVASIGNLIIQRNT